MAKKYIPGVSGLLTEPNPVDSPANTLSEAENVTIESGGKVQSRHGFNVQEKQIKSTPYDNINVISANSLPGNYSFASGAVASELVNYSGVNYAILVNAGIELTLDGFPTNIVEQEDTRVPYPSDFAINYTSKKIRETVLVDSRQYYTITSPASKSYVSSDGNIPTTASFFVKRLQGSCVLTVTFGIGFDFIFIPVAFNLDALTYQIDPQWLASSYNAVKYFDANIQELGFDWYKISVTCQFRTDLSTGFLPYNPYYITIYPRLSNDENIFGQNEFELPYTSTPYASGISAQTYVAGVDSTRLNVSTLSSLTLLRVGDYISFTGANVIPGLTFDRNYRISEINTVSNYLVIEHPGETSTGTSTTRVFTSNSEYLLSYVRIYQNPNLNYHEYIKPDSTLNTGVSFASNKIKPGTKTRLLFATDDLSSFLYPYMHIKLVKTIDNSPETNLPEGMNFDQEYSISSIGWEYQSSGIYAGFSLFYIELDVATTGPEISNSNYIQNVGKPIYLADKTAILPIYNYTNQYAFDASTVKFLEYKDSSDAIKTVLFVKQTKNAYQENQTGIYSTNSAIIQNRYYLVDDAGKLGKYETLPYSTITNVFATKETLYLQTENGLAEANIDSIDSDEPNKFFDIKWPAFPQIIVKNQVSDVIQNWLRADTFCLVRITFFRELGYTQKEGIIYESQPSNPIYIYAHTENSVPEIYLDFRTIYESTESYKTFNEFVVANKGRKFGINIYRTKTDSIYTEEPPIDYYLACPPIYFDNFLASSVYEIDHVGDDYTTVALRDALSTFPVSAFADDTKIVNYPVELNVGDILNIAYDDTQTSSLKVTNENLSDQADGSNSSFQVNRTPIVSGNNSSSITTNPSDVVVQVNGVVVQVSSVNGMDGLVNLASAPADEAEVLVTYYTNTKLIYTEDEYYEPGYPVPGIVTPYRFSTTDTYIGIRDYKIPRIQVSSKQKVTLFGQPNTYVYQFTALDRMRNTAGISIAKDEIIDIRDIVTNRLLNSYNRKCLLLRSYIAILETNDNGIIRLPQLYTNSNKDGEINSNILVPKASKSFSFNDFQIYYDIQKPLEATLFTVSQPEVQQIYFHHLQNGTATPSSTDFYLPSQNIQTPKVGVVTEGLTESGGRVFVDSPVFIAKNSDKAPTRDVEVSILNDGNIGSGSAPANRLKLYFDSETRFAPFGITYNDGTTANYSDQNLYNTYKFNATLFEQAKLTLKLTSLLNVEQEVSIKTTPFYNRRGYYRKYTSNGFEDQGYLYFDLSINDGNGIQLTDFPELLQRQYTKLLSPTPIYPATSPAFGKNYTDPTIGYGVFNVVGDQVNQTPPDGKIKGFSTTDVNNRGFYFDNANGKFFIRNDGTKGDSSNTFDLNAFAAPGHIVIQHRKSVDGTGTAANWNSKVICVYSYKTATQKSNGQYELGGVVPVVGNLGYLISNASLHAEIIIDVFALTVSTAANIALYPYSDPPTVRQLNIKVGKGGTPVTYLASIDELCSSPQISKTGTVINLALEKENSPAEPFFTIQRHNQRSSREIARISTNTNNLFFQQPVKSQAMLLDDYTNSIIDGFNLELRLKGINATLSQGGVPGEILISYPDGKKIEMRSDFGSHEFFPNLTPLDSSSYVLLAERTNNEYVEKNIITWSRIGIPEITTPKLYQPLGKNSESIIGHAANVDDFYIFKEDGIYRGAFVGTENPQSTNDLPSLSVTIFSTDIICQSANSIQQINDEIIFISQYGFMSISNGGINNISRSIERDVLNLLSVTPKDRVRSFVNESRNLYFCTLVNETEPSLGVKTGTYVFNVKTRQWSFMDEEILDGIEDSRGRTLAAYRQRPVTAKITGTVQTWDGIKPTFDFSQSYNINGVLTRTEETTPIDLFYITREQLTNNVKMNASDQYDYASELRNEGIVTNWIQKSGTNEFFIKVDTLMPYGIFRNKFYSSIEHSIKTSWSDSSIGDVGVIDSYVTLFANRSLLLKKVDTTVDNYTIKLKKTEYSESSLMVYFEFDNSIPTWFSAMSNGYFNTTGTATYQILAGIPVKIVFNPETNDNPDTNKLFQEYMIHTETANRGASMAFITDSRSTFSPDRKFVYDANANTRNIFRTYIPTSMSRGRYLIRQVKHDLPLENLIITGQTIVMRDSGSTRVQKDKDNE